jgi:secreted trypsin-like serine protease
MFFVKNYNKKIIKCYKKESKHAYSFFQLCAEKNN